MKKRISAPIFSAFILVCLFCLPSCRKSAFPRDPYRGTTLNPKAHPQSHARAKDSRRYRRLSHSMSYSGGGAESKKYRSLSRSMSYSGKGAEGKRYRSLSHSMTGRGKGSSTKRDRSLRHKLTY
jgi:hypothetical protein